MLLTTYHLEEPEVRKTSKKRQKEEQSKKCKNFCKFLAHDNSRNDPLGNVNLGAIQKTVAARMVQTNSPMLNVQKTSV